MGQWTPYHWHKSLKRFHPDSLVRICDPDKPNELGVGFCKVRDLVGEETDPGMGELLGMEQR